MDVTMKRSEAFEQQVHRIHELLEQAGATVTWNEHFPDPDNPAQMRQSDVTIRRGDHLTLVECRDHEHPQDVQWIEELIGRRQSLVAQTVMAVSSSGFTKGAIAKAAKHGIAVRDFRNLTDGEVQAWGGSVSLTLYFYQYSAPELVLGFRKGSLPNADTSTISGELAVKGRLQALFNAVAEVLGAELAPRPEHEGRSVRFDVGLDPGGLCLCGQPVIRMRFRGSAQLLCQDTSAPIVVAYREPGEETGAPLAVVERFAVGETSIIHDGARIGLLVDISTVVLPPLCQFRFACIRSGEEVEHESLSLVGIEKLSVRAGKIGVTLLVENDIVNGRGVS
jgi:hypothetical protein